MSSQEGVVEITDPLVGAIAVAIEGVLQRGVRIRPDGEGWLIQLADDASQASEAEGAPKAEISRSW